MKEKYIPLQLEIIQLEALDILTSSIVRANVVEVVEPTYYGETPPVITGATPNIH